MTRFFDVLFSTIGIVLLSPLMALIVLIGLFDTGSPFFCQQRMGKDRHPFWLIKFRTMHVDTQSVHTHLVRVDSITRFGKFLRSSKLDELPQLFNVLQGSMSLVGPRPNLLTQELLIKERSNRHVYSVRPGITGLAQIKKIDMSVPERLAETDEKMISSFSVASYFRYIILTVFGKGFGDRVKPN
ncbi:MAG: sugar transferase [Sphingomonadales bacterium]